MPMQAAENMDKNEMCFSDRGMDMTIPISMAMTSSIISMLSSDAFEFVDLRTGEHDSAE